MWHLGIDLHRRTVVVAAVRDLGETVGSQFRITLPKFRAAAVIEEALPHEQSVPSRVPAAPLSGGKVVVVDDDAEARSMIESVLKKEGATTFSATSAVEAMKLLHTHRPHLLISDLGMPEIDGFELIKAVRLPEGRTATLPALALSAYTSEEDRRRAFDSGFQVHLGKPVEPRALVAAVIEFANNP